MKATFIRGVHVPECGGSIVMLRHQFDHQIARLCVRGRNIQFCRRATIGDIVQTDMAPNKKGA